MEHHLSDDEDDDRATLRHNRDMIEGLLRDVVDQLDAKGIEPASIVFGLQEALLHAATLDFDGAALLRMAGNNLLVMANRFELIAATEGSA